MIQYLKSEPCITRLSDDW